ncbi:MAG TPA: site-specific DNA-methyltransferase [Bryobacteraceae bacterium]|nr:site-specific DNA-methyltransferase [Bryobacteraceae bacterium]
MNSTPLAIEHRAVADLIPYARNPRTHTPEQVAQVAASIIEFGWTNPILIGADNVIIAGHARLEAARKLCLADVPVIVLDHLSPSQRRALVIADNRLALSAGWDEEMLGLELEQLREDAFDLDLLGFDEDELASMLADPDEPTQGLTDEDEAPAVPEVPVSVTGDVWLLGTHRLMCGDARTASDLDRLLCGHTADLVFTDPPYNVDYEGYTEERLKIKNDRMSDTEFNQFLDAAFRSYRSIVKPGGSLYVCHASSCQREFQNTLEAAGFEVRCQIIWAKNTFAWGFGRYKFQHEPLFYCHVAGESDAWYGDKSQSTLWQEKKPAANRLHPTMKPVELIERALMNSSKAGDVVVDLFGGSGSTLIACERRGRHARIMEIDPKYADVIVRRWQEHVGKDAVLEGDGRSFEEVSRERLQEAT